MEDQKKSARQYIFVIKCTAVIATTYRLISNQKYFKFGSNCNHLTIVIIFPSSFYANFPFNKTNQYLDCGYRESTGRKIDKSHLSAVVEFMIIVLCRLNICLNKRKCPGSHSNFFCSQNSSKNGTGGISSTCGRSI